jgi:precorrin-2 dehydrogenase/sirohydrochlorin ferrochelatase
MIPLYLDPANARIALIGRGALALRRLLWLRQGGAEPDIFSDEPSAELIAIAPDLQRRLPRASELAEYHAIWIADLPHEVADELANTARSEQTLVNVEDVPSLCDFHTPAVLRRGKLTLAAGTGGASPAVARAARERLQEAFPETWGPALEEIAQSRTELRAQGASFDALVADARTRLQHHRLT